MHDGHVPSREVDKDVSLWSGDGQCLVVDFHLGQKLAVELLKEYTCTLLCGGSRLKMSTFIIERGPQCLNAFVRCLHTTFSHTIVAYLEEVLSNIHANTAPWSPTKCEHPASVLRISTHTHTTHITQTHTHHAHTHTDTHNTTQTHTERERVRERVAAQSHAHTMHCPMLSFHMGTVNLVSSPL